MCHVCFTMQAVLQISAGVLYPAPISTSRERYCRVWMSSVKCLCCREGANKVPAQRAFHIYSAAEMRSDFEKTTTHKQRSRMRGQKCCSYHPAGIAQVSYLNLQLVGIKRIQGVYQQTDSSWWWEESAARPDRRGRGIKPTFKSKLLETIVTFSTYHSVHLCPFRPFLHPSPPPSLRLSAPL